MIEAGIAWIALIAFDAIQALRKKTTLSRFPLEAVRKWRWLKWVAIGLVALLTIHLAAPLLKDDPPPPKEECSDG